MARAVHARALAGALGALLAAGGCVSEDPSAGAGRPPLLSHAGPRDWEMRVLQEHPPYGLVRYVEPALPGVPELTRGVLIVGKAWLRSGRDAVARACEDQWGKEAARQPAPEARALFQARRAGVLFTGWETRRRLEDGTVMRMRALCGSSEVETAFIFLSAPDQSSLYEPVWEKLLLLNLGAADPP
jgi:hypothetical protein